MKSEGDSLASNNEWLLWKRFCLKKSKRSCWPRRFARNGKRIVSSARARSSEALTVRTSDVMQWRNSLAESTTIHGLKEVLTENHRLLRPAWVLLFVAAIGSSALFVHKVVREYMDDPTATKVG